MRRHNNTAAGERLPPMTKAVAGRFAGYPDATRANLLEIRKLIFDVAANSDHTGPLIETLKWGQPAYLPIKPRIGTTVRVDALEHRRFDYAIYVHCQTTLVATFRHLYPDVFAFEGDRALLFANSARLPREALRHCLGLALTYHLKAGRS